MRREIRFERAWNDDDEGGTMEEHALLKLAVLWLELLCPNASDRQRPTPELLLLEALQMYVCHKARGQTGGEHRDVQPPERKGPEVTESPTANEPHKHHDLSR